MKKYLLFATALVALASCSTDELVSDNAAQSSMDGNAISFTSMYNGVTRAAYTGADAAAKLNNNFVVEGVKSNGTLSDNAPVFDHYNVNWVNNTANTTTSNTANWEYVAQTKNDLSSAAAQTIKYWDYSSSQYDFIAWSAGTATAIYTGTPASGQVLVTKTVPSTIGTAAYTVKGAADDLAKFYVADLVTYYRDDNQYNNQVNITFRSLSAKVRVALYETVPGYSVKGSSVKFYTSATDATPSTTATLYTTGTDVFNSAGTYTVYYPTTGSDNIGRTDYNKAHLSFTADATSGTSTTKTLGTLDLTNKGADKETAETAGKLYLGRNSSEATFASGSTDNYYTVVIPNETGAVLNLKVDYTLVSTDGSGEEINVTGAMAQVPADLASWKSGYAYTYIFKISQNTNGVTNPTIGPAGLYPITFDAIVTETEDGVQETITTVTTPSITTYAKGVVATGNDEYTTGSNIYVIVENGTELTVGTNANLYTVTLEGDAAQTINEASVANALANGTQDPTGTWTVTDANNKKMTVTAATGLTAVTEIAAADAPNGNAINVNGAKFTPTAAATYVFEYISGTDKYYKIIKVQ